MFLVLCFYSDFFSFFYQTRRKWFLLEWKFSWSSRIRNGTELDLQIVLVKREKIGLSTRNGVLTFELHLSCKLSICCLWTQLSYLWFVFRLFRSYAISIDINQSGHGHPSIGPSTVCTKLPFYFLIGSVYYLKFLSPNFVLVFLTRSQLPGEFIDTFPGVIHSNAVLSHTPFPLWESSFEIYLLLIYFHYGHKSNRTHYTHTSRPLHLSYMNSVS